MAKNRSIFILGMFIYSSFGESRKRITVYIKDPFCGSVNDRVRIGFQIAVRSIFVTVAAGLYNRQFLKVIRRGKAPPEIIMSSVNRASSALAGDKSVAVGRFNDVSA